MIRATVAEPSGHLATLERSCYGAVVETLMSIVAQPGRPYKALAPHSGAQLNGSTPFAAWAEMAVQGLLMGFAPLRPGNVQPKAQVQTTRRATSPHPGCLGANCHRVQPLLVDDHATTPQSAIFKLT